MGHLTDSVDGPRGGRCAALALAGVLHRRPGHAPSRQVRPGRLPDRLGGVGPGMGRQELLALPTEGPQRRVGAQLPVAQQDGVGRGQQRRPQRGQVRDVDRLVGLVPVPGPVPDRHPPARPTRQQTQHHLDFPGLAVLVVAGDQTRDPGRLAPFGLPLLVFVRTLEVDAGGVLPQPVQFVGIRGADNSLAAQLFHHPVQIGAVLREIHAAAVGGAIVQGGQKVG